jgi:hypothetical protein
MPPIFLPPPVRGVLCRNFHTQLHSRVLENEQKADFMGGAKNISEGNSTASKRAGELTARLWSVLGDKSNFI